jgi:hypothetical protein
MISGNEVSESPEEVPNWLNPHIQGTVVTDASICYAEELILKNG